MANETSYIKNGLVVANQNNQSLTKPSESATPRDLPKYLDREEINHLLALITNQKDRMLCTLMWMTGLRVTEVISIRKRDVDARNFTVTVRWLKSRKYRQRVVPLHPRVRDLLQVFSAPLKEDDLLFSITRQRAFQITRKWMNIHPHQLRHSFAVNWLRCGGDVVTLHRMLGHSSIQTTMEYLKIVPVDQGRELLKVNFD